MQIKSVKKSWQFWATRLLLLLLVASFGLWGIGDIFRSGREPAVAEVGEQRIDASRYNRAFQDALERLRQTTGEALDIAEARARGLDSQVLFQLIGDALIEEEALALGLRAPDAEVARRIADSPYFRDESGRFSSARYREALRQIGTTAERYEEGLRRDSQREQLWEAFQAPPPPAGWVETLHRHRHERRTADYVLIPNDGDYAVGEPSEEELRAFYDENDFLFAAPEYRRIRYIAFGSETLADEIAPSEEDLYAEYEARLDDYHQPERRDVVQLLVPNAETAEAARALLISGQTLTGAANALAADGAVLSDLGVVSEREMLSELAPTVFALSKGGVSNPIETAFGFHFFWVRDILPAATIPFAEVRDDLARDYRNELATDALYQMANALEDDLAGGANLDEAAARLDLPVLSAGPIDVFGNAPGGVAAEEAVPQVLVDVAFETDQGLESHLIETPEGEYYLLRVEAITPSGVRPYDEVREQVLASWRANRRAHAAETLAREIAAGFERGEALADLAAAHGLEFVAAEPMTRRAGGQGATLFQPVLDALFALREGERTALVSSLGSGYIVAALDTIAAAEPAADPGALAATRSDLAQGLALDIMIAYQGSLQQRHAVDLHFDVIERIFGADGG